ncbi:MAG: hypothetical protein OXR64_00240 [Chloroflexota bacterium]|nr:hypothetical protein [Chloroflexota bacterium]
MPEMLAVGLEAATVVLAMSAACLVVGYGLTRLVAPPELRATGFLLVPLMGAAALIVGAYALNLLVDLRITTAVLLGAGTALSAWTVRRDGWWLPRPTKPQAITLVAGALLLVTAFLPHLHGRSGAMLGLNIDEDLYVPLAEALKWNTVFMHGLTEGPFQEEFQSLRNHSRGWGFPYLLSIGSILSNAPAFHAYAPLLYLLLAASVPAVYIFARAGLQMSERPSGLAATLYAIHGLPLWFAGMGFGPHTVAFALFPLAAATGIVALRRGDARALALAALISAALLVSYFWAISAVYLAVAVTLVAVLVVTAGRRRTTLRRAVALGAGTAVLGAPGIVWLLVWALPQLVDIAGDLNGQFGNAWGDRQFANVELAFGLEAYRLIPRDGPLESLLGTGGTDALEAVLGALFWPALALALLGALTVRGNQRVTLALAAGFAGFMLWVAAGAGYHYGHFKNLSYVAFLVTVLLASGIANIYHGEFKLWNDAATRRLEARLAPYEPALSRVAVTILAILSVAMIYNTYLSVWWNWQGVGWNVERRIAHDARAVADEVPPGSRVYFGPHLTYPVPDARRRLSDHVLGFHFPRHQTSTWAGRTRSVWMGLLVGRELRGFVSALAFSHDQLTDPDSDYLVLNSTDDPRIHGLLASDAIHITPYWTIYQDALKRRLTANDLGNALGSLDIPSDGGLQLGLRNDRLATGAQLQPASQPILFGVVAATHGVITVSSAEVAVDRGLTWITAPPITGSVLEISAVGRRFRPQIVAARLTPEAAEAFVTTEHVTRHVVSVDVRANNGVVSGVIITTNPTGTGGNVGLAYQESPRNDAPASHGFWQSAAHITAPAQRIEFHYDPTARTLTETVDGRSYPLQVARQTEPTGDYRLSLPLSRGQIDDLSFPLMDYSLREGALTAAQSLRQTYVFDMPVRPLLDWQ